MSAGLRQFRRCRDSVNAREQTTSGWSHSSDSGVEPLSTWPHLAIANTATNAEPTRPTTVPTPGSFPKLNSSPIEAKNPAHAQPVTVMAKPRPFDPSGRRKHPRRGVTPSQIRRLRRVNRTQTLPRHSFDC